MAPAQLALLVVGVPPAPAPPIWLTLLSALGGASALVALLVGVVTVRQKWNADRREAWWKRAQWAMERSLSEDPRSQDIGTAVLVYLDQTKMTKDDERLLLGCVGRTLLADLEPRPDIGDVEEFVLDPGGDHG